MWSFDASEKRTAARVGWVAGGKEKPTHPTRAEQGTPGSGGAPASLSTVRGSAQGPC